MSPRPLPFVLVLAALVLIGEPALAYPDARVEARITPAFGDLLWPPVGPRREYRRHANERVRDRDRDRNRDRNRPLRLVPSITVGCGDPRFGPRPLNDALAQLIDGGSLHILGGAPCNETLDIHRSVVIIGEGVSAFSLDGSGRPAIAAPDGAPCLYARGPVKVEIRDVALFSQDGGRSSCIETEDAEVALVRTSVRYNGDRSAISVSGGRLIIRDGDVDAGRSDSAVMVDDAAIQIEQARIGADLIGLDLTPSLKAPSSLRGVRVIGLAAGDALEPRTAGIVVRGGQRASGALSIRGTTVTGWRTGMWFDVGSRVEVSDSRIGRTVLGVLVDGAEVAVRESAIGASEVGLYAGSGRLTVDRDRIFGFRNIAVRADRAVLVMEKNSIIYPLNGCASVMWGETPCYPMSALPYELRVEDARNDWGVHAPFPPRGPDGYGGGAPGRESRSSVTLGVGASVTLGVATRQTGRPDGGGSVGLGAGAHAGVSGRQVDGPGRSYVGVGGDVGGEIGVEASGPPPRR